MARAMASNGVLALFVFLLMLVHAHGATTKPRKVKCKDKNYPKCYKSKDELFCPNSCLRTCHVDCASCLPVCPTPPPPPPPSPPPPPPRRRRRSPPPPPSPPPPIVPASFPPPPFLPYSPPPPESTTTPNLPPPYLPPPPPYLPPPPPYLPPPPPSTEVESMRRARCRNKNYPNCFQYLNCPSDCPTQCEVDCVSCKPVCDCNMPGAVCQDPKFVGGDGITFYFHGKKDKDYCLLSDSNLHINAHFIGKRKANMTRDFTWVQSIGVLFDTHKLSIAAQKTSKWDDSIDRFSLSFDGESIHLPFGQGANWVPTPSSGLSIIRSQNTNALIIKAEGNFKIKATIVPITDHESRVHNYGITSEDCFAHLDLSFRFYSLTGNVSGVLGQTYATNYVSRVKVGVAMPVLGGDKEFSTSSLFATDSIVSRFKGKTVVVASQSASDREYATI